MNFWTTILAIVVSLVLVTVIMRQINKYSNPLVLAAHSVARQFSFLKRTSRTLPEGSLLNVPDQDVREIGYAMLIDGAPTKDINTSMLDLWFDKFCSNLPEKLIWWRPTIIAYPGYEEEN